MPRSSEPNPLGNHARDYLALLESLGRVIRSTRSVFKLFAAWLAEHGVRDVREITPALLETWRVETAARNHPRTLEQKVQRIRRFFLHLFTRGVLAADPAALLPHRRVPRMDPFVFTLEEVRRLLTEGVAAIEVPFFRLTAYTFFHLLYATGMRRSEALQLKVQDLDLETRTLHILRTKFHKERMIPFGNRALENLKTYLRARCERHGMLRAADPVFVSPWHRRPPPGPMDPSVAWHLFHRMLRAVGLRIAGGRQAGTAESPRIHSLRASFAVHRLLKWYREGADLTHKIFLLSTYMGHRGPDETAVYLRATEALLTEAKELLGRYLLPVR